MQVLRRAHQRGHRIVELVSDAGAQLAKHREAGALNQLGASSPQILKGGRQRFLLRFEVLGEHRVFQMQVLGAHQATRQGTNRESRQRPTDRRILRNDDLQLLSRQTNNRRIAGRHPSEKCFLRAGQRHEADQRTRRGQVCEHLAA